MDKRNSLGEQFERNRSHLIAAAYRMLGSMSEAEDAVQEGWVRLDRSGGEGVENLRSWLTTVVARVCLDMLRSRKARREDYLDGLDPELVVVSRQPGPEQEVELADSVGLALLVVLESLTPAERLAFVLHDMFAVPFDEVAHVIERTPAAARQLASRARRRVQGAKPGQAADLGLQFKVAEAFLTASREGNFEGLVAVLDPDAVLRIDTGPLARPRPAVVGASNVAQEVLARGSAFAQHGRLAVVNGSPGAAVVIRGKLTAVVVFKVIGGRIASINITADPEQLKRLAHDRR